MLPEEGVLVVVCYDVESEVEVEMECWDGMGRDVKSSD